MTVEPSYRPDYEKHYVLMRQWSEVIGPAGARTLLDASLVPDTTVQAIADAPKCEHGNIYTHVVLTDIRTTKWCDGAPKLARLLNALTEEADDE